MCSSRCEKKNECLEKFSKMHVCLGRFPWPSFLFFWRFSIHSLLIQIQCIHSVVENDKTAGGVDVQYLPRSSYDRWRGNVFLQCFFASRASHISLNSSESRKCENVKCEVWRPVIKFNQDLWYLCMQHPLNCMIIFFELQKLLIMICHSPDVSRP